MPLKFSSRMFQVMNQNSSPFRKKLFHCHSYTFIRLKLVTNTRKDAMSIIQYCNPSSHLKIKGYNMVKAEEKLVYNYDTQIVDYFTRQILFLISHTFHNCFFQFCFSSSEVSPPMKMRDEEGKSGD